MDDLAAQLHGANAAATSTGLRKHRRGTQLYSDSIAYLKGSSSGGHSKAMLITGCEERINYCAGGGCSDIAALISRQTDVAVAMTTCNDWAGLDKQGKPAVFAMPENMTERLLKLCVALVSHANKVLLVIGGPAHVWGQSQEWDARVAQQVSMVNSWGVPCHWGDELEGAYTVPGENMHLHKNCRDLVDKAWQAWISQAREPLLKSHLSSDWQQYMRPIELKLIEEEVLMLGEQRVQEDRQPPWETKRPREPRKPEPRKPDAVQQHMQSTAQVSIDAYDSAALTAQGLIDGAEVRLSLISQEQEELRQEFIVQTLPPNILMFRVRADPGKYLRIKPKTKKTENCLL